MLLNTLQPWRRSLARMTESSMSCLHDPSRTESMGITQLNVQDDAQAVSMKALTDGLLILATSIDLERQNNDTGN